MAVSDKSKANTLADLVDALQARGRYTLGRPEALASLQVPERTLNKAVVRLSAKVRIVVPRKGFYVIVPLEYRSMGSPPPTWFIDDLMRHLGKSYYVGVLSAAALYGAAHQQPQEFQIVTEAPQRPIVIGRLRIRFVVRRDLSRATISDLKTDIGTMRVSSPETTALDLIRFTHAAGGLSNVATVLTELWEKINPRQLVQVAQSDGELAFAQRLGYLLDVVGGGDKAALLAREIERRNPRLTPLRPGRPSRGGEINRRWRVVVNDEFEADI